MLDLLSFAASRDQAKSIEREAKVANAQEDAARAAREADRQEELAAAISSQRASAAGRGISAIEGSPLAIMNEDVRRAKQAKQRDDFSTDVTKMANTFRAKSKASTIRTKANIGLLKSAKDRAGGWDKDKSVKENVKRVLY